MKASLSSKLPFGERQQLSIQTKTTTPLLAQSKRARVCPDSTYSLCKDFKKKKHIIQKVDDDLPLTSRYMIPICFYLGVSKKRGAFFCPSPPLWVKEGEYLHDCNIPCNIPGSGKQHNWKYVYCRGVGANPEKCKSEMLKNTVKTRR